MNETTVLFTSKEAGVHQEFTNLSYLDKAFFDLNPIKAPEANKEELGRVSTFNASMWRDSVNHEVEEEEEEVPEHLEGASLQ